MAHASDALALFLEGPALLRRSVEGMTRDQLTSRPIEGAWSSLEVVAHLADSEQAWCHRLKRVIAEDRPLLVGYDETRFAATLGYHDRDVETELKTIELMRGQMGKILLSLPAIAWARVGVHTERGLVSLDEMVRIEADHLVHHVGFIQAKRKAVGL